MASEQRTEPGDLLPENRLGTGISRVRLRQDPPVIADRVWRFGTLTGISRPGEAPFVRKGRREVVTRAYGSSSHALHAEGGPFVMPL